MGKKISAFLQTKSDGPTVIEGLAVKIYNKDRDGDLHRIEEGSTCEAVCHQIGQKLGISPILIHCFGLRKFTRGGKRSAWISLVEELRMPSEPEEIHFRMRFIPNCVMTSGSFQTKQPVDVSGNCFQYLYWQVYWDFLHDKLEFYRKRERTDKVRGLTVLGVVILMRQHTELCSSSYTENLNSFLESTRREFRSFFPSSITKRWWSLEWLALETHMKRRVKEYQELYPCDNSQYRSLALMKSFVRCILQEEKSLFLEHYQAFHVLFDTKPVSGKADVLNQSFRDKEKLDLIVDMGRTNAELFISKQEVKTGIEIGQLSNLELEEDPICKMYKVKLIRTDSPPEVVYFDDKQLVDSFITCLEGYYRLCCDYYQSLCKQFEPQSVRELNLVKAHGPVSEDYVNQKIEKHLKGNGNKGSDVYMLYKSLTDYGVFELARSVKGSKVRVTTLGKLIKDVDGYSFMDSAVHMTDLRKLMAGHVKEMEGLHKENCIKIQPKSEGCDILEEIFVKPESCRIPDEDEEEEMRRHERENLPKVFMRSEVEAKKYIGKGYFTEVYQGRLKSGETVIMKCLRREDIIKSLEKLPGNTSERLSQLEEAFEGSFETLLKLNNPKYFLNFVGVAGQTKLLKEEIYGNLKYFLETKSRYECQLTMRHLQTISIQLAHGLEYMEGKNCFHGNLHCENVIVTRFERHEMLVKISDPGMVSYYNRLELETVSNRKRLPWIAPEVYDTLAVCNIRTEVYSYGMTLWQMYNEGQSPLNMASLMSKCAAEICEFFSSEKFQLPHPQYLKACEDDSKAIKSIKNHMMDMICKCCSISQEDRLCPKGILKDLNGNLQDYGNEYHDYNIIYEQESASYPVQSTGSMETGQGTGGTSGIVTNAQPVAVPFTDMMKFVPHDQKSTMPRSPHLPSTTASVPVCDLTPGCELKDPDQATGMAILCRQHPILPAPQRSTSLVPIVSDVKYIIKEGRLEIYKDKTLGSGYYGNIYRGTLAPSSNGGLQHPVEVAVKALKVDQEERFLEEFKKEASIMETLHHPNIVKFYGIYQEGKYMVMELVERGSLIQYVHSRRREHRLMPEETQLQISIDITSGMEYLTSNKIIHCDLAARNVLLTSELRGKVSDFGLSRVLCQEKDYYRRNDNRTIPILWCAPEWIGFRKYFYKSDVWSFGVVLWEIYSYGKTPLIGAESDLNKFYKNLFESKRLSQPTRCSDEIYSIMHACWKWEPDHRLSFSEIRDRLETIVKNIRHDRTQGTSVKSPGSSTSTDVIPLTTHNDVSPITTQNGVTPLTMHNDVSSITTGIKNQPAGRCKVTEKNSKENQSVGQGQDQGHHRLMDGSNPYNKANAEAAFVESMDVDVLHERPVKNIGPVSTNTAKTEPPGRKSSPEIKPRRENSFHGMQLAKKQQWFIGDQLEIDEKEVLGKGRFGKVYSGMHNGEKVAVKKLADETDRYRFQREYELLQTLHHPNIVRLVGFSRPKENGHGICYVMECMGKGSLYSILMQSQTENSPVGVEQKIKYLIQIAQGMAYLFSCCIVHCDLKADNVLVNDENIAKISDFGLAKHLDDIEADGYYKRKGGHFIPNISAPETMKENIYHRCSDIWSYGVLCLQVFLNGNDPNFTEPVDFQQMATSGNYSELYTKITAGEKFQRPGECPDHLYEIIQQCWELEPMRRIPFADIIHKFKTLLDHRATQT